MIEANAKHGNLPRANPPRVGRTRAYLALLLACGSACTCKPSTPPPQTAEAPLGPTAAPDPGLPKIDVHMHVALEAADIALTLMRDQGIAIGLNASGGFPESGLPESVAIATASAGRLLPYCNIQLSRAAQPDFADYVHATLTQCKALGARGVKIPKSLGLGVVGPSGHLLAVDDPVFDPIFEDAGRLHLPVLLHSGDPKAFFKPATRDNERFAELQAHPGWSFYGISENGDPWPTWETILDQFERRVARHPQTTIIGAHFGNAAEEPERVARMLDSYPNYFIDTAARVPEFGRHAAAKMRAFFVRYQDRILFGSDLGVGRESVTLGSSGAEPDRRTGVPRFFQAHWLYFETQQPHLTHPTPIQGSWTVDGIGLPRSVLEKLYFRNAARLFSLSIPTSEPSRRN